MCTYVIVVLDGWLLSYIGQDVYTCSTHMHALHMKQASVPERSCGSTFSLMILIVCLQKEDTNGFDSHMVIKAHFLSKSPLCQIKGSTLPEVGP